MYGNANMLKEDLANFPRLDLFDNFFVGCEKGRDSAFVTARWFLLNLLGGLLQVRLLLQSFDILKRGLYKVEQQAAYFNTLTFTCLMALLR